MSRAARSGEQRRNRGDEWRGTVEFFRRSPLFGFADTKPQVMNGEAARPVRRFLGANDAARSANHDQGRLLVPSHIDFKFEDRTCLGSQI